MPPTFSHKSVIHDHWFKTLLPVFLWTIGLYALIQLLTWYFFDLTVWKGVWLRDAVLHFVFGVVLFALCRGFRPWAAAYTLLISILQISNAMKFSVLGSPIMPDDFIGFVNMFLLFDDWRLWAMGGALLIPLAVWIYAIAWHRALTWAILGALSVVGFGFVQYASPINRIMDQKLGDRVWDQPGNYKDRGLLQHVLHETSRNLARGSIDYSADQIRSAKHELLGENSLESIPGEIRARNVYIIALESFWDPTRLSAAGISEDPLDPRFRALWQSSDFSTALAPVYGGYTANSEFEILCGFPVTHNAVFFEGWLRNRVPCLPDYLTDAGYRTVAAHPNHAAFWNRVISYDRIGFSDYWAKNDFDLDDMNGPFLSDSSLYRQVWQKQSRMREAGQPLLSYILTYFGHLDYPLNEHRSQKVSVDHDPSMIERYVNTIYYKSRELMDFYEQLRANDPEAVIVIFGDHLPYLGPNFSGYVESGLMTKDKADFSAPMFLTFSETPLIIIDGQNGPVKKRELPMYLIPSVVTQLLGDESKNMLNAIRPPQGMNLRPLPGITLVTEPQSKTANPYTCVDGDQSQQCAEIDRWLRNVKILTSDIFSGEQQALTD